MNPWESLIRNRWIQSGMLLFMLAGGIWFGSPHLSFGEYRPFAPAWIRVALIIAFAVYWGASLAVMTRRDRIRSDDAVKKALHARFAMVEGLLRKRRQGRLPWYLVLGAEGAGTSNWLPRAGFDPLHVRGDTSFDRPMASCDWWCDGHAVMLDLDTGSPHGEDDPGIDAQGWPWLLANLSRSRRHHAIGGVVIVASLPDMHQGRDVGPRRLATSLRTQLDDVLAHVGDVPVYVVFSKADLLAGFIESFRALDDEGIDQVWGATFPLEEEQASVVSLFDAELEGLVDRLDRQLISRLHLAQTASEGRRQFDFPQQLRCHAKGMREFVDIVLGERSFGGAPRFRGFYLVSATQEGPPDDPVSDALQRSFGIRVALPSWGVAPRRGYFATRLSRQVWLREAGLARGTGRKLRMRGRWALAVGTAVVALAAIGGTLESYRRNMELVTEVDRTLHALNEAGGERVAGTYREYYTELLRRLDIIDRAERRVLARDGLMSSLGLSQRKKLLDMIRSARWREIGHNLLPGLFGQFRAALDTQAEDPRRLYFALRGYLVLSSAEHAADDGLEGLAREAWRSIFPHADGLVGALAGHLRRYRAEVGSPHVFPADEHLVEVTRASLKTADIAMLVYTGLKLDADIAGDPPLRLDRTLGLMGDTFLRRGGASLSDPLPGIYTRAGFIRMMGGERDGKAEEGDIARAVARFAADGWVFGDKSSQPTLRDDLQDRVSAIYVADYMRAWEALIGDLDLQPVTNLAQAGAMARRLSGQASPLRALLLLIREHTEGLEGDRPGGDDVSIAEHFAAINQLTKGQPGMQPIDRISATLEQVGQRLASSTGGRDEQQPALALARLETAALPAPLATWMERLLGSSQTLVTDGWEAGLRAGLREAAGSNCVHLVRNRYPFVVESANDIPIHDFSGLFGRGGRFDTFRRQRLDAHLDVSKGSWALRDNSSGRADDILHISRVADDIREAYFRESPTPTVTFSLLVDHLPDGVARVVIDIDGQSLEYRRDEYPVPVSFAWPGPRPGLTRIQAWDVDDKPLHGLTFTGEWSWFHALDAATLETRTETRFGVTFLLDGKELVIGMEALSLHHPFGGSTVRRFRCPA